MEPDMNTKDVLTRREILSRTLKASAYAAPVILSVSAIAPVAAATPPPLLQPLSFGQDAALTDAGANALFDVYYTPSNRPGVLLPLSGATPILTDAFGFGGSVFPLALDSSVVTSVKLTYILHGLLPSSPPAATFTSNLIAALAPVNGRAGGTTFAGLVVQEPTTAACALSGGPTQFTETIDVALVNGPANTAYDFYVRPAGLASPVLVAGRVMTNAAGEVTVIGRSPVISMAGAAASVTVLVLPAGAPVTSSPAFALTASGATLVTISCTALASVGKAQPLGISVL